MSNPRLVAEDIAQHYEEKCNKHLPHAKNVRRYLRKPVLAITRRILLPRTDYEKDVESSMSMNMIIGNEKFGERTSFVDPTFSKAQEGLDWRDYLSSPSNVARTAGQRNVDVDVDIDTDLSFSETETETEDERNLRHRRNANSSTDARNDTGAGAAKSTTCTSKSTGNPNSMQAMKLERRTLARMEAFLASCAYALPNDAVSAVAVHKRTRKDPIQSIVPNLKSIVSSIPGKLRMTNQSQSSNNPASSQSQLQSQLQSPSRKSKSVADKNTIRTYPQMSMNSLILRLELYIRTLRRMHAILHPKRTIGEISDSDKKENANTGTHTIDECVVHLEPPRALKTRISLLITSLISTVGSVGSMRHILNNLLVHFTREMLAVEVLSEDLQSYIRKIVLEYEHLTSFASLAFLSTPEDSAETQLAPLLSNYVEYLQAEWKKCVWECRLEGTLARSVDPTIRKLFKTVEFVSIGHLLDVCHEHRHALENIVVSSKVFDSNEVDLYGTGAGTDGGNSNGNGNGNGNGDGTTTNATADNPNSFLSSASFDKNTLELCGNTKTIKQALRDLRRETIIVNGQILPPVQSLKELIKLLRERLNSRPVRLKEKKIGKIRKDRSKSDPEASEREASDSHASTSESSDTDFLSSGNEGDGEESPSSRRKKSYESTHSSGGRPSGKRKQFNVEAIDILTRRLLIAASRTRGGGDAYFVVKDLFGGEDVQVVPTRVQTQNGPYVAGSISPTIELTVRLASITIKCHSMFDVYPENVHECEPFIQLKTSTTETIELQEVRIDDNGLELEISPENQNQNESSKPTKVMLKEKAGELSGRRVLAIKPAKYERVDNWHTPS